jgi:hypothetical protein
VASSSRFYRRRFLNRRGHHAGAYVIAAVNVEPSPHDATGGGPVSAYVTIADCGRVATLDFDVTDATSARNALHKARLLRDIIDGFVVALEAAVSDRTAVCRAAAGRTG